MLQTVVNIPPPTAVLQFATPKENRKHRQITFMSDDCVEKSMDYIFFGTKSLLDQRSHIDSLRTMPVGLTVTFYCVVI